MPPIPTPPDDLLEDKALESLYEDTEIVDTEVRPGSNISDDATPPAPTPINPNLGTPAPIEPVTPPSKPLPTAPPRVDVPKTEIKIPPLPTTPTQQPLPANRDYSQFDPDEIPHMQRMSNEVFDFVTKKIAAQKQQATEFAAFKEASAKEAANVYYDPIGFARDGKYIQHVETAEALQQDIYHYQQQLRLINEGKEWVGYVAGPDGKAVAKTFPASTDAAEMVRQQINSHTIKVQNAQSQAEAIKHNWAAKSQNYRKFFEEQEDKYFPGYKGKEKENTHIKYMSDMLAQIGQTNNPLGMLFSKMYAQVNDLNVAYLALVKENEQLRAAKATPAPLPPTQALAGNNAPPAKPGEDLLDDPELARLYGTD